MKSKRIIITISIRDYEQLKSLAQKERLSVSSLVRHFIIKRIYPDYYTEGVK